MKAFCYSLGLVIFSILGASKASYALTCTTVCSSYTTCYYCGGTCNYCNYSQVPDPVYWNKTVNSLPFEFNYSRADLNPSNNTCGSSECGTKTCDGTTTDANNKLPTSWATGACSLTPSNKVPAKLNCLYKDHACVSYCSKWVPYSCCASYSTVCS